uniref:Vomeronasal type-1 receptor n=1 Tax=Oryctolagus cuniculus TaxID=9986 RepID=A0A5F9CG79_RABIT
ISTDLATVSIFLMYSLKNLFANGCLLLFPYFLYFKNRKLSLTPLRLQTTEVMSLKPINSVTVPLKLASIFIQHFSEVVGCKIIVYIHKMSRNISIWSLCINSDFQISICSPTIWRWAGMMVEGPQLTGSPSWLCFVLVQVVSVLFLMNINFQTLNHNVQHIKDRDPTSCQGYGSLLSSLTLIIFSFNTVEFKFKFLWTSTFQVLITLYPRHECTIKYSHSPNHLKKGPCTSHLQNIIVLIGSFMYQCHLTSQRSFLRSFFSINDLKILNASTLISGGHPIISQCLIIVSESFFPHHCRPLVIATTCSTS